SLGAAPAPPAKPDKGKADLKRIQGTWVLASRRIGPRPTVSCPDDPDPVTLEVRRNWAIYRSGGKLLSIWEIRLDATHTPPWIDMLPRWTAWDSDDDRPLRG